MLSLETVEFKKVEISVYVSNLGAYNAGTLTGSWVKLPIDDVNDIYKEDRKKFGNVPGYGEEYFISDYEAPFNISEYENLNNLNKIAAALIDDGINDIEDAYNALENPDDIAARPLEWDDFTSEILENMDPLEVMRATSFGHVSYNDDLLRFDAYGNFESLTYFDWIKELNGLSDDIINNYLDQNGLSL